MKKATQIFAVLLVAWQVPMALCWYLVYQGIYAQCMKLDIISGGGYKMDIAPDLILPVLWQNLPIILPLVACLVLSVIVFVWLVKRQWQINIPVICMLGASILACGWVYLVLRKPSLIGDTYKRYMLAEFMFYRYDVFQLDREIVGGIKFTTQLFPLLQEIKFLILSAFAIFNAVLLGLGIGQLKHKKVADTTGEESVDT